MIKNKRISVLSRSLHRAMLTLIVSMEVSLVSAVAIGADGEVDSSNTIQSADEALKRLAEGNRRFVEGKSMHPHESRVWRKGLESQQHPFAVILGCSDSRVPPELLFDQGFGDLFVIRVAGNVVDVSVIASVEYAIDHLGTPLILVLGHANCGAVSAAMSHYLDPSGEPAEIIELLSRIEPALVGIPKETGRHDQIDEAVKRNVVQSVRRLSRVPDLRKRLQDKTVRIVGAVYDIHNGRITVLDE